MKSSGQARPDQTSGVFVTSDILVAKCICLRLRNVFVSNCEMHLSYIETCICLIMANVLVQYFKIIIVLSCKFFLYKIANLFCLKLPNCDALNKFLVLYVW